MGSVSHRTYFDVTGPDRSGLGAQVAAQRARVAARLAAVRHVVAVMSGKGGVGKSHVTALLADALGRRYDGAVGVLDADLRSPTVARLLNAGGRLAVTDGGIEPARGRHGVRVVSTEFLLADGAPLAWREPAEERFLWRGALEAGALREFLSDVVWGPLEILLIDLPPGADGVADLVALVPALRGAVAVTIPTAESERSVTRALRAARTAGISLLGIVENMSGHQCPDCGAVRPLFPGNAGEALAAAFGVPLWARLPFAPGDEGHRDGKTGDALASALSERLT